MEDVTGVRDQDDSGSAVASGVAGPEDQHQKLTRRRRCSDTPASSLSPSSPSPSASRSDEAVAAREGGELRSVVGTVRFLASLPARAFQQTVHLLQAVVQWISRLIDLASLFLFTPPAQPLEVIYERQFGRKHPAFFPGAAQEAFDTARQTDRLLAVYLHSQQNAAADRFCRETLTDDLVIDLLDNTCVFYATDASVSSSEGARLARAFFPSASSRLPAFLLLLPQAASAPSPGASTFSSLTAPPASRHRVLLASLRAETFPDTAGLIAVLLHGQEKAEEVREAKRQQMREREENRLLREEQEREFAEVMRLESIKREEQETRRRKEEARRDRETQRKEAAAARRQERRAHAERLREQEENAPVASGIDQRTAGAATLLEAGLHPNSAVLLVPSDDEED
ncbi:putative UBX domain-containing protein [Neospora caninum Liverpool]|uniref:Putative UBX domain-containing protein n=1 Tax=Neospora caninum (strain Liverpool) TaxID=572307 RepID=F0VBM5_NEOCL|nr:putative UBX domain-containing protein [Neospora caninum Liverpool]CBZ51009.1 putative UBX domain-containing protein [Neospora caninum Liverpool]|eukprot:XP_003881042.1 putative UBX domain-containing protein [Neospora caninum Liverpool]